MIYYDLREEAQKQNLGRAVARDLELKRIARTLSRQYNNSVLIVGAAGTGKTAILEGFCQAVVKNQITGFENSVLAALDTAGLKKLIEQSNSPEIINYLQASFKSLPNDTIIFIDDFENILGDKPYDFIKIFEPFFENGGPRLVIACSESKYPKLLETNPDFLQRFELIRLKESDIKETHEIITSLAPSFEKEYAIKINSSSLKSLVEQAKKTSSEKKYPLAAVHLLDEAMAFAKISGAAELTGKHIAEIFAEKTGVPASALSNNDAELLRDLEKEIGRQVIGQDHAVKIVSNIVRRGRLGLRNPNRPTGSFLFLGPSGVGKTELAKVLAKTVYGSERAFTRIDMSEFGEPHTVQRLVGAPPGYVGFESGGQLTNSIKEQPYSLILLDEIEKADPKIFDIFLQVFDDGRLTDGQGQTVNFTNSIVVATSNLGIKEIVQAFQDQENSEKGFARLQDPKFLETELMPILMNNFRTEFLNRFDAIIIFNPLPLESLVKIALLEIKKIQQRTQEHKIRFNIDAQILSGKIAEINDYRFGARPIKRFIEETCENLIAAKLFEKKL